MWAKNVAKRRRDAGLEYVAIESKTLVPAARVGSPCTCPKKCFEAVGEESIKKIFEEYWRMGNHDSQSSYLATRVSTREVARHYAFPSTKRNVTHEYSVVVSSQCKG